MDAENPLSWGCMIAEDIETEEEGIGWKAEDEGIGWKAVGEGIGWKEEDKGIGWKEESALEMMDAELMTPPTSNSMAFARPPNLVAFTTPTTPPTLNIVALTAPTTTPDIVTLTPNVVADLGSQREVRLTSRDEITESARQRYLTRFVLQQLKKGRFPAPKEGDLVLLRRAALDNRYDKKLEARWEGPFRLSNLANHGRSGRLYDLITGRLVKIKQTGLEIVQDG